MELGSGPWYLNVTADNHLVYETHLKMLGPTLRTLHETYGTRIIWMSQYRMEEMHFNSLRKIWKGFALTTEKLQHYNEMARQSLA